jgi:hypothetical protein
MAVHERCILKNVQKRLPRNASGPYFGKNYWKSEITIEQFVLIVIAINYPYRNFRFSGALKAGEASYLQRSFFKIHTRPG